MMYSRQKIFSVVWLCAITLLLAGQKQLFAQTIQSNYGIPDYINVANGSVTFKVKIIGAATPCSAATLDITLPPGHMFVSGSAVLESTPGSSGIISDTSSAPEANSRRIWINNIPQFPGVTELSFKVYANCSGIGVNNPNINYVLSGCTATPATLSSGMITRNAQLNITQVTNNNIVGPVDTVFERKITLRNDGYGTIDTFYIDSRNQNSLQVVSYTADPGASISLTKIMAGTDTIYRYKIIKPGSLSNGESFSITEQVKIVNCSGSYLTAIKSWYGVNGQECSAVSNNINAGAILASRTSSMAITRKGSFTTGCRGDVVSDTLILRNNGTNPVIDPEVAFSGYNSTSGNIFGWTQSTNAALGGTLNYAINPATIKYKAKINGVWQSGWSSLTADSSLAVGSAGIANSCFGANDKIAVWSHMPFTMVPNDSVLYVIEGRQCSYTACSEDATAVTRLDARFRSACGDPVLAVGAGTSYVGRFELQPTDFPLDVVPGETFSLGYYVPSIGHIAPQLYTNGQVSFTIDLPAQFNWTGNLADISFFKGTTNLLPSGTMSYTGNPGGTITFTFTPVVTDNYYIGTSFEIRNITVDPTLVSSSVASVDNGVKAKRKTSCPELQLFCTNKTIQVKAGPGTCPQGGLSVGRIQTRRINYGAPDALNNGTVNGTLDMNKVKTKYVMTGDTLEVTYWGRVIVTGLSPVFNTGGVTSTYSLHVNKLQPLNSTVSLYNSSAVQVGVPAQETLSFGSGSTANQSSVSFGIADFNDPARTAFQNGDSVVVKKYFRIIPQNAATDNDNTDFIQQVVIDNNIVYLGNTAAPAVKYNCGEPLRQWFNMVSLRIAAAEVGNRNAVSCTELDYTLRLNAFVGGSGAPFIFEQRKVFEVSQVRYQYPAGLTYAGTTTGGTPVNAAANPLVYNGPFTNYPSVTDESRVNFNLIRPFMRIDGCLVTLPLGPIVSAIDYKKYPDFNTVRTIDLSNTVNSIVKPTLTVTSPLPELYTGTDSISWVVRLAVTGGANSYNTFLGKSGTSGVTVYNIQRVANISAATGTNLTKVGDVFQAGTINNGVTNFFRVFATASKCEKDTLQLAYGWDCAGYPASINAASCKQTFNLAVTPYSPALQLNVVAQGNGTSATSYTLCDTLEYELEVTNSGLGLAHDLAVQMQLPATGGIVFVPGSFGLKYPLSQPSYTAIDDVNVQSVSNSLVSFNIPDNNLPDLSTADKYRIKFKMTFNSCSFSGGSRVTFRPVGMKSCQQSVLGTGQSAKRIALSDAPELIPSFTFSSTVDSTTACVAGGASTMYRFKLTNNTFTTTGNDGFRITLPDNWVMDTSTISFLNGNVTGATLDTILPGNIYDFNIGSGLASAQSVQFTAVLNNTTALACGNLDTIEETGYVQFNAVCVEKGLNCTIKQLHETDHNTTIYTQRPAYSISNFTAQAGTLPNHLVGAVTITNANTAYIAQNGTLRLYKDVNNNGVRDNGDILLGSQSYPLTNLSAQTFNYDFTGYVGQVCPLLAVFESCACDTPTAVKPGCDIVLKAVADLSLTKTVNNMTPVVGSNVIFTLTLSNAGPNAATGVSVKDILSNGYTFVSATGTNGTYSNATGMWTLTDTLESGASDTLHIEATVKPSGNYTNYAQVFTANEEDPDSTPGDDSNNQDDDDSVTPSPEAIADLSLSKTVNNMTPLVGSNVIFTLTLSNAGPNAATGVSIKDILSSGYTFVSATGTNGTYSNTTGMWTLANALNAGASDTLRIEATVKASGNYTNYAQVFTANEEDPDSTPGDDSNNQDDDDNVTPVPVPVADLSLSKTVNNMTPLVGSNVIFTITLSNAGPNTATGVSVKDMLSNAYTFVSATGTNGTYNNATGIWTLANPLASAASDTLRIEATVKASGNYTNYAQVFTANEVDPDSTPGDDSNNQDDDDSVTPVPVPVADLSLSKTVNNMTPLVGSNVIFTITLSNAGPSAATGVSVKDMLSNAYTFVSATGTNGTYNNTTGIWTLANPLASAASDTLHIEATVNATGNYTNYAQVFTANEEDPDSTPGDDSNNDDDDDSVTPQATPVADLSIVKSGPATINAGESFSYTLTISNAGPSEALNFTVKDPAVSQFAATGISCNVTTGSGTGTCPVTMSLTDLQTGGVIIPSLKKDGVLTLTLTGTAGASAQLITNIAYVTPAPGTLDPDTTNNSDTATTRINSHVAGNVYNDINGLFGVPSNTVNGIGTNVNDSLYVHLVDNSNTVIATQQVQANGSYNFPGVVAGTYSLVLNVSAQPSAIPSLPGSWVNTGENLGSGAGSDGQVNGILTVPVGNTNIDNANFGIELPPTATDAAMASRTNPGGNLNASVSPSVFVTADPAPGAVWFIHLTGFPANADNILVGGTTYNASTWPANGISIAAINGQPLLPIQVDPVDGNTVVTLPYVSVDQAGKTSDTAIASVPFHTITISGHVFNDINGLNGIPANTIDGPGISFSGLYAVLTDVITDTVMAIVPVSTVDGSYSFAGMDAGAFGVRITTLPATVGGPLPAIALPPTWLHTGEHLGAGAGNDGFADGILYIGLKDVDVTEANFGIEQPPVATSDTAASQLNPGGNISVAVPPATFVTIDPAPGAVATIVIFDLPSNANSITIGATVYSAANPLPPGGVSIPVNAAGQPVTPISVDPVNGEVMVGVNYYATDEAGKQSDTATAYLPFSTISITGTVYHDANGLLGQPANTIDGTGTNAGNLKAVLVRNNNNTVAAVTDVAANGYFAFEGVNAGDYRVVITTTVNGNQNPNIQLLPGWVHTGEYVGTGAGNDGTADGSVNLGSVTTSVDNIRFGIQQLPEAYDVPASFQLNPGGTATVAVSNLGGNDPEDGTKGNGNTFVIVTLPAQGTLYYNGQAVVAGDTIHNYNPASLTVDPVDGNASVSFQYSVIDTAGFADPTPATVTMNFIPVPLNGNVFHDANGIMDNTVNGTGQGQPSGTPLYANLVDPQTNEVIASVTVNANGTYQFGTVRPADTLSVQISTLQGIAGQPAPAIQLPPNWVATGEHTGTGLGHDNQPDGMQLVYTGVDYNGISQVNFGIEQPPVADEKTLTIPSAGLNVAYPLSAMPLSGSDPEDGSYGAGSSNFIFGQQPVCCGIITYNGDTLSAGDVISNYNPSLLSVIFTDIMAQQVIFTYGVTDAAGKQSPLVNYIINTGTVLPVDWLYFTAKADGEKARLEWSTAREENNTGFDIERSSDAVTYNKIGYVNSKGINGNSSTALEYVSYDETPASGINYYRLKQTDIDGHATYSEVRPVTFGQDQGNKISVYPNPTTERVFVKVTDPSQVKELRLLGVDGRVLYRSGKDNTNSIDMSVYASGTFVIQVELKNGNVSNFNIVKR